MSEVKTEPKVALAELVDAYASARATNNEALIRMSVSHLNSFLSAHDVVEIKEEEKEEE